MRLTIRSRLSVSLPTLFMTLFSLVHPERRFCSHERSLAALNSFALLSLFERLLQAQEIKLNRTSLRVKNRSEKQITQTQCKLCHTDQQRSVGCGHNAEVPRCCFEKPCVSVGAGQCDRTALYGISAFVMR